MIVGIDVDSFKATLCAVPFDGGTPILVYARWRQDRETGEALSHLGKVASTIRRARSMLQEASPDRFAVEPSVWFIERGFGMSRGSDYILGAFTGAIMATICADTTDPVNLMDLREWKADVTATAGIGLTAKGRGNGNAKKEVANEACRALLALTEIDASDWTPDQLDSWGIAFAGRRLNARAAAQS